MIKQLQVRVHYGDMLGIAGYNQQCMKVITAKKATYGTTKVCVCPCQVITGHLTHARKCIVTLSTVTGTNKAPARALFISVATWPPNL